MAKGGKYHGQRRYPGKALGNTDTWRNDDFRVAVILLIMATVWIATTLRRRQEGRKGWLERLGIGFGNSSAPGFATLGKLGDALDDAGLSTAGLIVGVDFTRSNEWTGQKSYANRSMHDVAGPGPNPYQEVLEVVGHALGPLNHSKKIWCYGFGDEATRDESVFCFMADDQPCRNLDQALDRYAGIAPAVLLSGPTSFAPLIRKAIEIVVDSGRQYHCLVIIADGQVTKERETVKAIQEASSYPLSIIMIGVGVGPWDTCHEFDNRLPGRRFDNFRFVEHRRLRQGDTEALALSALAEVPDQFREVRRLGLMEVGTSAGRASMAAASVAGGGVGGLAPRRAAQAGFFSRSSAASSSSAPSAPPSDDLDDDDGVPEEYVCPLTLEVMVDPVVCEDGHSYERGAVEAWLRNHDTSPMSNARLNNDMVVPNHALRNSIEAFRRVRGY